ncbi:right-handed parallel beta-helix repeat-containing protein [Corallococcus macrosporus]|uniref:Right-handed parallel beta-helix repeat-containing protein n=1 Tax=Corallococcus macrosporus TaxID=35 RepID=A0ABS3DBX8_9BACT|nr:parallel beta-helix domain-containing protein [Corallococcus macrosporus]MBN8229147.1 right-handed parallel beta-helix repeat-containing protein [Corallococcus macrosporus]
MPRLQWTRASSATLLALVGALSLTACSDDDDTTPDSGVKVDAGTTTDAGSDAGTTDAGSDAGSVDTGIAWDGGSAGTFSCEGKTQTTLNFAPGQEEAFQDQVNTLAECTTITLAPGTYTFDNAITIRKNGITLVGAGKGAKGEGTGGASSTVLVFTNAAANSNGLDVVGDRFTVSNLAVWNAKKDAIRVESSTDVVMRGVRTEWEKADQESNGKYGLYPVKSKYVLIEDCEAYNAADAGIYVGQTEYAVVRNSIAKQNVAGIEIENTKFAYVLGNTAQDNTTGLVVFDLPGNPIKGTDIRVKNNVITGNNRNNFASVQASSSTVSQVPAGTGTFMLASRRVELTGNTWGNNNTVDVAVLSGLTIDSNPANWSAAGGNWASADVYIHDNTFQGGSGDNVDNGNLSQTRRPLGAALAALYAYGETQGTLGVEHLVWDGLDPVGHDRAQINPINICFVNNTLPASTTTAIVDLDLQAAATLAGQGNLAGAWGKTRHYAANKAEFNCAGFSPALTIGDAIQ